MNVARHREATRWLDHLPEEWDVLSLKQCADITYGFPADSAFFTDDPNHIPLVRIRDVTSGVPQKFYSGRYPKSSLIDDGDLLVGMDGDFNLRVWMGGKALLNQRCCRIKGRGVLTTTFLSYALPNALREIHNLTLSTTVKHLLSDGLEKILLPVPSSMDEVMQITSVLDAETAKIDEAMSVLRNELEAMEQLKKSLIYEVVTKGRDPSVAMKSSGVEWIGDIPEHWETKRLKYVADLGSGTTPDSANIGFYESGEIPWIQSGDLYRADEILTTEKLVTLKALRCLPALSVYRAPFVVVAMYGASIGNTSVSLIDACLNQACCHVSPKDDNDSKFLFYAIRASQGELLSKAQGGTQKNISQVIIKNHPVPIPPASEQKAISDYLNERYARITESISLKQRQVGILEDQRRSMILEYVTGKRRVSEVA